LLVGELAVPSGSTFSLDALLQRIHPAASRVAMLSKKTPAIFIVFDLLAGADGKSLLKAPLGRRRKELESFVDEYWKKEKSIRLSPQTADIAAARQLKALIEPLGFTGNAPGGTSRWSRGKSNEWEPLNGTCCRGLRRPCER